MIDYKTLGAGLDGKLYFWERSTGKIFCGSPEVVSAAEIPADVVEQMANRIVELESKKRGMVENVRVQAYGSV
jgi:hypothetical protein